jgi:hypothetical protein
MKKAGIERGGLLEKMLDEFAKGEISILKITRGNEATTTRIDDETPIVANGVEIADTRTVRG